jgi:YVTN family beta-propeller protein
MMPLRSTPFVVALCLCLFPAAVHAAELLELETKIPLGEIKGRIDHFAIDLDRQRLFVAELGNDSVGVIDLKERKVIRTITGLSAPQGLGFVTETDTLYVANAGDGVVHLFKGDDLAPDGTIDLKEDADNIRVDAQRHRVYVGYGDGALAVIDPLTKSRIADIPLKGHPEGFQLAHLAGLIFVNVPDAEQIAVIDTASGKQVMTWPTREARANFPLALDSEAIQVLVGFREPARLMAFDADEGKLLANVELCGDTDDIFADAKRERVYVSCGAGFIDIFARHDRVYSLMARMPTVSGARTAFFSPELDRYFLAVRAADNEPAAVWLYRPTP